MLPRRYSPKIPPAPENLSQESRDWWEKLLAQYALDDPGLLILANGLEALDRMRESQALLKAEGLVVRDRFGQKRPHPAAAIERDAKGTFLRNMRALGLDLEPVQGRPGRPSGR